MNPLLGDWNGSGGGQPGCQPAWSDSGMNLDTMCILCTLLPALLPRGSEQPWPKHSEHTRRSDPTC